MKRIGWVSVIAVFLGLWAFAFGMLSRQPLNEANRRLPPVDSRPIEERPGQADAPVETGSTRAYREARDQMRRGMDIDYTGDADVDFLRGMIAHHEGAIAMARIAVEHGEASDVRGLAQEIIVAQKAEIIRMRIMLARHASANPERP
ncbi:CopM family metallochaperone [Brevundimonas naejangsanensis]